MKYSLGLHKTSTLSLEILKNNYNTIFFETGTNFGEGVVKAIDAGFKKIISIDVVTEYINAANERFIESKNYPNTDFQFYLGDSRKLLPEIIDKIDEPITFWLDGHEFYEIPLLDELVAIKNHKIKNHTILIDDVRMFNTIEWNNIGHDNVIKLIMEINENYKISYYDSPHGKNDILLAKI